jgi:hypothetical protein
MAHSSPHSEKLEAQLRAVMQMQGAGPPPAGAHASAAHAARSDSKLIGVTLHKCAPTCSPSHLAGDLRPFTPRPGPSLHSSTPTCLDPCPLAHTALRCAPGGAAGRLSSTSLRSTTRVWSPCWRAPHRREPTRAGEQLRASAVGGVPAA